MEQRFEPAAVEARISQQWEAAGAFRAGRPERAGAETFCVVIPPPNVTGNLHMGHALNNTLQDILCRYHRMNGKDVLWQPGTDHAGIATQIVVERQLMENQEPGRREMGREKFLERVWKWKNESGGAIVNQLKRLGASCDWSRERFTMDEGLSKAVAKVFVALHRDGLIYKAKRLVNWDPKFQTAISDLEVVQADVKGSFKWARADSAPLDVATLSKVLDRNAGGHLFYFDYPVVDSLGEPTGEFLTVATTRPETMLGDTGVAVHPEDERFRHLVGKRVRLPLVGRLIAIIADEYSDPEKGTGAVKITPAHDFNDFEVGKRHEAEGVRQINILDSEARVQLQGNLAFFDGLDTADHDSARLVATLDGQDRFVARKRVVEMMALAGLLAKIEPHAHTVPHGDRSNVVIEPWLTDQWYVDAKTLAQPALAAVREGRTLFTPANWQKTYFEWLENIQPWCVSRQLWWGHQIPAWYAPWGSVYVEETAEAACAAGLADGVERGALTAAEADAIAQDPERLAQTFTRDEDVLDTWFSSALWPFSTLGWPDETPELKRFYPTQVLVTGFDIIFFWVARMVMATKYFTGQVPFREVYINAIVRDAEGQKMSKSKGNTLDPLDLIDGIELEPLVAKSTGSLLIPQVREKVEKRIRRDYPDGIPAIGTDALRFTFAALASYSRTINFDIKRAEGYKAFCNKLWNAARYVLGAMGDTPIPEEAEARGDLMPPGTVVVAPGQWPNTEAERWILTRLKQTLGEAEQHYVTYRFDLLAQTLYEFVWNEYCDWFIEFSKPYLNAKVAVDLQGEGDSRSPDIQHVESYRYTLLHVLESVLRALHPLIPFTTEEIWQSVAPRLGLTEASLMQRPWPRADEIVADDAATAEIEWFKNVLGGIRRIRSEMNISPAKTIPLLLADGDASDRVRVAKFATQISFLARVEAPQWIEAGAEEPAAAAAVVGSLRVMIPLAGLIDLDAEKIRLAKEITRIAGEIRKCEGKLGNANFVANAPAEVVEQERQRITDWNTTLTALREQAAKLQG